MKSSLGVKFSRLILNVNLPKAWKVPCRSPFSLFLHSYCSTQCFRESARYFVIWHLSFASMSKEPIRLIWNARIQNFVFIFWASASQSNPCISVLWAGVKSLNFSWILEPVCFLWSLPQRLLHQPFPPKWRRAKSKGKEPNVSIEGVQAAELSALEPTTHFKPIIPKSLRLFIDK